MHASKTKQRINSSINCSSKHKSLERLGHACDRRKRGHNPSHVFMRVYCKDEAWEHLSRGAGEPVTLRPQHQGVGFLHPGPQMAADDQPGREKPPRPDGGEETTVPLPNCWNFSSAPGRTSLPSSRSKSQPSVKHPDSSLSPSATALTLPLTEA